MTPNKMTKEELTRTQVLNINDVEQAAKKERKKSFPKRVGVFILLLGIFSIISGVMYNPILEMAGISNNENKVKIVQSNPKNIEIPEKEKLVCSLNANNFYDGTDRSLILNLTFNENDLLTEYSKVLVASEIVGNPNSKNALVTLMNNYKQYEASSIPGFSITTENTTNNNISKLITTVNYDLVTINKTLFTENMNNDFLTKVDFEVNTPKENIKVYLESNKYQCN